MTGVGTAHRPRAARPLRVLAATELGANWGHLLRIAPVLEALRTRGHAGLLASADAAAARRMFAGAPVDVVACPSLRLMRAPTHRRGLRHYAELLENYAFGDDATLVAGLRHWFVLLDRLRPDVLLTDFSPTAVFAAHLRRLPLVQLPTGWEAPPAGRPLPAVAGLADEEVPRFAGLEARLLARLNRRCAAHDAPPLGCVADLYALGTVLLAAWPEMDHFGPRDAACYVGPIYSDGHGAPVAWPDAPEDRERAFVYLAADARAPMVVEALGAAGVDAVAVLPGLAPARAEALRSPRVQVFQEPVRLDGLLPRARLVVGHGGAGLIGASLRHGVPQLLLPTSTEQSLVARQVAGCGLAHVVPWGPGADIAAAVAVALGDDNLRKRARVLAADRGGWTLAACLADVVDAIERAGGSGAA